LVELDAALLVAAISALFAALSTGGTAVIRHLLAENKVLREEISTLRAESVALAKSAIAALDKMGSK
jgi:hypothetical protein